MRDAVISTMLTSRCVHVAATLCAYTVMNSGLYCYRLG
jgi:hypothetical protein